MRKRMITLAPIVVFCVPVYLLAFSPAVHSAAAALRESLAIIQTLRVTSTLNLVPGTHALDNTFTIPANPAYAYLSSSAGVTSDTTTAIRDGQYDGQLLLLKNNGAQNITIKNSANTDLGSADVTLGATDYICLMWNSSLWDKLFVADN